MVITFLILQFLVWQFVFSYQRIALKTARRVSDTADFDIHQCQLALTPNWIGTLGWISRFLSVCAVILVFLEYGIVWSVTLAACIYLGVYALFSGFFEHLIYKKSTTWMLQGIQGIKNTGHGYLLGWKLEEAIKAQERNNDRSKSSQ